MRNAHADPKEYDIDRDDEHELLFFAQDHGISIAETRQLFLKYGNDPKALEREARRLA